MTTPAPVVEPAGPGLWRVRIRRAHDGTQHAGEVVVRAPEVDRREPPHVELAAARAWHGLSEAFLRDERVASAIATARQGIWELGSDYSPTTVKDDTRLKLAAAEDLLTNGREADAARMLDDVLSERIELYEQLYADELADPGG